MNVAFIPVRGGSKSIPMKNIREIAGKPLVYWALKAASECGDIDRVYVSTDSNRIKEVVENLEVDKVTVIGRSRDTASDTASTESAMLEFAEKYEFDNIVLVQATSPLLTSDDLDGGFLEYNLRETDSVLSVVRQKRFQWKTGNDGLVVPLNYDILHRPRRQEFSGFLIENGAFYITSRNLLLKSRSRISGRIRAYEMDEVTYLEIDEPSDWEIIENYLKNRIKKMDVKLPDIKLFLTDCDGCLTDGGMYYSEKGDELKRFNTLDGMGMQLLQKKGILTGIITGEKSELAYRRSRKLKVDIYEENVQDKLTIVRQICDKYGFSMQNIAYLGDDINDLDVIKAVGFGCSVQNGVYEVKKAAMYITQKAGGSGAIREVADLLIKHTDSVECE